MNGELVPFLLELLESPLTECEKPSATKALIAESLKTMATDLENGEKVCTLLGWWALYGISLPSMATDLHVDRAGRVGS